MEKTTDYIGYCEVCGLLDHHLTAGVCSACESKVETYNVDYSAMHLGAEADVSHSFQSQYGQVRSKPPEVSDSGYTPYFLLEQAT